MSDALTQAAQIREASETIRAGAKEHGTAQQIGPIPPVGDKELLAARRAAAQWLMVRSHNCKGRRCRHRRHKADAAALRKVLEMLSPQILTKHTAWGQRVKPHSQRSKQGRPA